MESSEGFDKYKYPPGVRGDALDIYDREWVGLYKGDITTGEAEVIASEMVPEWWVHFKGKNNNYGDHSDDLGVRGQYADIHRKMKLLRNSLWDGKPLAHEQPREVILDLIGHLFLTLAKGDKNGWGTGTGGNSDEGR